MSLLTLTAIVLTPGGGAPENITTALSGSPLSPNTGILFQNTGRETVIVQTNSTAGGTTVTSDIGTTIQGQAVPGVTVTEPLSTIEEFGPFPSQYNKTDGTNDIEIDFGTPANVTGVIVVRQGGVV
jgi:hypothetical protein